MSPNYSRIMNDVDVTRWQILRGKYFTMDGKPISRERILVDPNRNPKSYNHHHLNNNSNFGDRRATNVKLEPIANELRVNHPTKSIPVMTQTTPEPRRDFNAQVDVEPRIPPIAFDDYEHLRYKPLHARTNNPVDLQSTVYLPPTIISQGYFPQPVTFRSMEAVPLSIDEYKSPPSEVSVPSYTKIGERASRISTKPLKEITSANHQSSLPRLEKSNSFENENENLTDLHIYVVPTQYWNAQFNSVYNTVMNYTVSAGFIRVYPEVLLADLKPIILEKIGRHVPRNFIYLKSVGRALTRVRPSQEKELKVKNFLPPFAYCPELFIIDKDQIDLQSSSDDEEEFEGIENATDRDNADTKRNLADQERELQAKMKEVEYEVEEKKRALEEKLRELERSQKDAEREQERKLKEAQRELDDQRYKQERELQEQRDKMERELNDMRRSIEKQQQDEYYNKMKEFDERVREQEKRIMEQQREADKQRQEAENEQRRMAAEQQKELMQQQKEIEMAKLELDKKQSEQERELMKKQQEIDQQQRATEREKALLEQRKKMEQDGQRIAKMAGNQNIVVPDRSDSRPNSSPSKMKFPRPASPQLREDLRHKLQELAQIKADTLGVQDYRDDLLKKAKALQSKAQSKRTQARDYWKKKYFEEKKKTSPLEEHCKKLRREMQTLNRRVVGRLEKDRDSQQDSSLAIAAQNKVILALINDEMETIKQNLEDAKMKYMAEIKLRKQAENELKALRAEVVQKKINAGMNRELQRTAMRK